MKKPISVLTMMIVLLCFFVQGSAYAKGAVDYSIKEYDSHVTINPDGSVYFDEYITYGFLNNEVLINKPVVMSGASIMEDLEIYILENTASSTEEDGSSLTLLSRDSYTLDDGNDEIYYIKIPVLDMHRKTATYVYRYKLKDVVFIYKDTAAFFWQFILPDNKINIEKINITVTPVLAESTYELVGFATGTIFLEKELLEGGSLWIGADRIKPGEYLETTLLMPTYIVADGRKIIDNIAREAIIEEMIAWDESIQNAQRVHRENILKKYFGGSIAALAILLVFATSIFLYLKVGKKQILTGKDEVVQGIPMEDFTPAELSVLYNNHRLGLDSLLATILHLVQRRYIDITYPDKLFGILSLRDNCDTSTLKAHEEYLINWLFKNMGNGKELPLQELDILFSQSADKYKYKFNTWTSLVMKSVKKRKFEGKIITYKLFGIGSATIGLLAGCVAGLLFKNYIAGSAVILFSVCLSLYTLKLKSLSPRGLIQFNQWRLFRLYLKEMIEAPKKSLPLLKWEEYMVYAIPLKVGKEIFEGIITCYYENAFEDGNLTILYRANHPWLKERIQALMPGRRWRVIRIKKTTAPGV